MNLSQFSIKNLAAILCIFCASTSFAQTVQIMGISYPSAVNTSCTNTMVDVDVQLGCLNAVHLSNTFAVSGTTITIDVRYSLGPICLGAISNQTQTVNLGMLAPNTYTVNVNGFLNGTSSSSMSSSLTIVSCCSASPAFTLSNSDTICVGDSINFTSTGTGLNSQKWFENNLFVSSSGSYGKRFNTPGSFDIKLVASDTSCADSLTRTILVNALPMADLGTDTSICMGASLMLYADTANDSTMWWDGSVMDSILVDTLGVYSMITYKNGCENMDTLTVGLNSLPTVQLGSDTVLCVGDSLILDAFVNGASYLWNDQSTASSLIARDSGTYSVTVTDANGCANSSSITVTIDTTCFVSISETSIESKISLYPNPVNDFLHLNLNFEKDVDYTLEIFDAQGRKVEQLSAELRDQRIKLKVDKLKKGLYFVKIKVEGLEHQKPFIKN